jgi:hypothetical protein
MLTTRRRKQRAKKRDASVSKQAKKLRNEQQGAKTVGESAAGRQGS